METSSNVLGLTVSAVPVINYALQLNGVKIIRSVTIRNESDADLENLDLIIASEPEFVVPRTEHVQSLPKGGELVLGDVDVSLNSVFLGSLSEKIEGQLKVKAVKNGVELAAEGLSVSVLALDEWSGSSLYPEMLSAFVTPNNPALIPLLASTAGILEEWTGDPSLDAYFSQDANRVLKQAAAVYGAIQKENIVYAVPPASFELSGQRIRLCDDLLRQKMGTCLDLTLLYTSCLEQMGLNPLLILTKGHAFAGVWLEDQSFPEAIQDDPSLISKRLAGGVNEIAVVECTLLTSGKNASFDDARASAEQKLLDLENFDFVIDVRRTRLNGIRPIAAIKCGNEYEVERPEARTGAAPEKMTDTVDLSTVEETPATRKSRWERKLLDIGLRNTLISMRMSKTLVPLLCPSVDALEDALCDGVDFEIYSSPEGWREENRELSFESVQNILGKKEALESEFAHRRLRSVYTETELTKNIKELYRASRNALEENGANTLYMALGLLRWYETPKSTKARYAPIVLIPIEMVRRSAALGYAIRLRDEDPQVNVTLLEKLKQDFGMEIVGLDPLPMDDHGVDIRKVFTIIRKAVMNNKSWDVLESAYLGIFSFSQFVMWNDIRNRADDLAKNKVVSSLMEGHLVWDADEMKAEGQVEEGDVLLPISADASQLFAIKEAAKGESFVLHGPPGTGKSQTITAMIANALAAGKTVLFVAEKMAALEVVQKRLDKIGLGPFCLELHSNKSRKRDVLEQLKAATEVIKTKSPQEYALKAEQIGRLRSELDEYAGALHQEQHCGFSLFDIIGRYEGCKEAPEIKAFRADFVKKLTRQDLDAQQTLLERLVAAARLVGHPAENPLKGIGLTEYSQKSKAGLESAADRFGGELDAFGTALESFLSAFGMSEVSADDLAEYYVVCKEYALWSQLPESWAKAANPDKFLAPLGEAAQKKLAAEDAKASLSQDWHNDFFSMNGKELLAKYREICGKWSLAKALGLSSFVRQLAPYAKSRLTKEKVEGEINKLIDYQERKADADTKVAACKEALGELYKENDTDWKDVLEKTKKARGSAAKLAARSCGTVLRTKYFGGSGLLGVTGSFCSAYDSLNDAYKDFRAVAVTENYEGEDWVAYHSTLVKNLKENFASIKEWITWNSIAKEAKADGLGALVDAYYSGIDHEQVLSAYTKAITMALANEIIDRTPAVGNFSGAIFDEKVSQLRTVDSRLMTLTQEEIYCRLAAKVPNFVREAAHSSELGILQRAIKSGGRGVSIRSLFEQLPNMLPRLCPCMLMSPISAAQYLDPKREPFDIVIFDEASQLPTCKAVGALARGRDAVVVGDPKQMPPTSFFTANTVDEDFLDIEDLESILDDCLALNMPQTHLLWHYRSRHESLIAFSNSQFYENKLYTFPSVNDLERKVTLVPVDGVFERGKNRCNRGEAQAIVEELKRRAHDEKLASMSVGVVTFNINQQNLIDDLLSDACRNDAALEKWAYESEEPLFIKNLENVQGDERDVILFSVCYGPDQSGKISMNFGPLNRDGGWRRLNVAVSRARCEMIVFSTLKPEQINLERTSAEGVGALKAFLEYASGKELSQTRSEEPLEISGIQSSICEGLREKGYEVKTNVGHSKYRIDIGVVDPENPDRYLLGILLDGRTYKESKTTRDREMAQIDVLRGLGWNILRVWTMDWWDNSFKEMCKILERVSALAREKDKETEKAPDDENTPADGKPSGVAPSPDDFSVDDVVKLAGNVEVLDESDLIPEPKEYAVYTGSPKAMSPEELVQPENVKKIADVLFGILLAEAPITESLLMKRVVQSFGIARSGSRIQEHLKTVFSLISWPVTQRNGQKVYWSLKQKPEAYYVFRTNGSDSANRDIREVPFQEIRNALCLVLYQQVSLSREDLIREAARTMKYTRLGTNVVSVFDAVLADCESSGLISNGKNGSPVLTEEGGELVHNMVEAFRAQAGN